MSEEDPKEPSEVVIISKDEVSVEKSISEYLPQKGDTLYAWDTLNVWNKKPKASHKSQNSLSSGGKSQPKQILKQVSGSVKSGQLLALMGASGAGKTTLLNILNFNSGKLYVEGQRCINGAPATSEFISSNTAYVQQEDLFLPALTVREHLIFTSRVRISGKSTAERLKCVDFIIHELGLTKCQHTRIGHPARSKGISGGEMKRLSFASEYLTDPVILFCDEPTSGLDSFMAQSVVRVMQKMAQAGKSVICTIHQPASEIFEMFDHIYLLSVGRVAFTGTVEESLDFFDKVGYPCPLNHNPADFFIFTLAVTPGDEENCRARASAICDAYETSSKHMEIQTLAKYRVADSDKWKNQIMHKLTGGTHYKTNRCIQFIALLGRSFKLFIREPIIFFARMISMTFLATMFSLVFMNQTKDQGGVKNINGCIFFLIMSVFIQCGLGIVFVLCDEAPIFLREHWNGMYRTDVYYVSKVLVEAPFLTFLCIIFSIVTYYSIGFEPEPNKVLFFIGVLVLLGHVSAACGYMVAVLLRKLSLALTAMPCLLVAVMVYSGFFLRDEIAPDFMGWLKHLSFVYYSSELLFVNQYEDMTYIATKADGGLMQFTNGSMVLEFFNYKPENWKQDLEILAVQGLVFHLLAYGLLLYRAYARKG